MLDLGVEVEMLGTKKAFRTDNNVLDLYIVPQQQRVMLSSSRLVTIRRCSLDF